MNLERAREIFYDFQGANNRLKEAINDDLSKGSIVIDGTIQRFEFTFELSWKLSKAILLLKGIEANSPRDTIKEAFKANILDDGDGWIEMLEDRNKSAHIYDEEIAIEIYRRIKDKHYNNLKSFEISSSKILDSF